jgi:hypothetical protein
MVHISFCFVVMVLIRLGGSVHTTKTNEEALVVAAKESGLEVIADKTNYTVMSRDQDAGRNRSVKSDNNFFEKLEEFKYLTTSLTNQNSIQEEISKRLRAGNACRNVCRPVCYPKI